MAMTTIEAIDALVVWLLLRDIYINYCYLSYCVVQI